MSEVKLLNTILRLTIIVISLLIVAILSLLIRYIAYKQIELYKVQERNWEHTLTQCTKISQPPGESTILLREPPSAK